MIAAFAPLWVITILGWGAARFGVFGATAQQGLAQFAFIVAIPAVIFSTLVKIPFDELPLLPLAAFALSALTLGVLGFWLARGRGLSERVIAGMAASYVNSGNLGIPVAIFVLGDASLVVAVVAFQTVIFTPLIVGLLDRRRILELPLKVPVVTASLLGVLFSAVGWHLSADVLRPFEFLGAAAAPTGLFALGMSLHVPVSHGRGRLASVPAGQEVGASPHDPLSRTPGRVGRPNLHRPELAWTVLLKIVLQPLVAFLLGRYVFHLDPVSLLAVTLFAGLPTAQNTFVYATQYKVPNALSRDAVLVTSVLSLLSLSLILWLLGT